jgi:3-methyladenine DNA glycosylase AlkD
MIRNTALDFIIKELKKKSNSKNLKGMAKFGINTEKAFGINMPFLRETAKKYKNNHQLALDLWDTKFHEARILASLVDDPKLVTDEQVEAWILEFNSWDLCDQCCANLFEDTYFAYEKALEWSKRDEEFVKRAGFVMMARLAISDKKADDAKFDPFLQRILEESMDERNFVKKAVNWALRQTGKRSMNMNKAAILVAEEMLKLNSKAAKWIANDAIRELTNPNTTRRIKH